MIQSLFLSEDRRPTAICVGACIGLLGGALALLVVLLGPVMAAGLVLGLAAGLYVLTDLQGALVAMIAVIALLPFGKLPLPVSPTPSFLDGALGGFLLVYAMQWMTGQRRLLRTVPMTPIILGFIVYMLFAFVMGLRSAPLTPRSLRSILEFALSLMLIPLLVDVMRDPKTIRRAVLALIVCGAAEAVIGIGLWLLPDLTAEAILNRLGRFDYPVGGVIRYRQTPASILNERAIGTWIDPNAFGGFLMMVGALTVPQIFSRKPVTGHRWIAAGFFGTMLLALFLTDSRGSMLALGAALVLIAALRYRRLLGIMALGLVIALFLPVTQHYIHKFEAGIKGEDVETQMRLGEYKDALTLIERHPIIGVGFTGTPEIDLYLGVSNTYLLIASNAGLVGLGAYLLMIGSAFIYSARRYRHIKADPLLQDVWLGLAAAIVGMLVGGLFDHYYFGVDQYHAMMTFVWIIFGLMLASVHLAAESE
jgi:O-antigen ligase